MTETFFDVFTNYRLLVWENELDKAKLMADIEKMAELVAPGKEKKLMEFAEANFTKEGLGVQVLALIQQYVIIHIQKTAWDSALELSVPELEGILQAIKRLEADVETRVDAVAEAPDWVRSPNAFEHVILSAQRGSIYTMIAYRINRQRYAGAIPEWKRLDPETARQLAKSFRGKTTDSLRRVTVLKVHEYIKNGEKATPAVRLALQWLSDEHDIFVEEPKTVRRWAKKLGLEWWGR